MAAALSHEYPSLIEHRSPTLGTAPRIAHPPDTNRGAADHSHSGYIAAVHLRVALAFMLVAMAGCAAPSAHAKGPKRTADPLTALNSSFRTLSAQVAPTVVQILATGYAPVPAGGGHVLAKRRSTGSGVVVSARGYILTNAHVVQGAHQVQVRLPRKQLASGRSVVKPEGELRAAKIVGLDLETDLAVIQVKGGDLTVAQFGSSEALTTGELVLAFGAPFGLQGTVTMGVVSAVARQRRPDDSMIFIQTDAPINPGNSGGPLVNTRGQVVGINTFIVSPSGASSGLGFAVPSNIAKTVYEQLRDNGRVTRGIVGAATQSITPALAKGLGLQRSYGAIVADVYPGGPADVGGLEVGDIILTLDEKRIENARQFDVNVYHRPIDDSVRVRVLRDGDEVELRIKVVKRPMVISNMTAETKPDENLVPRLGVLAVDITDSIRKMVPRMRVPSGVLVVATSPGESTGALVVGDVIHTYNGNTVDNLETLKAGLEDLGEETPLVLQVERRGVLRYVPLTAE